MSIFRVSKRGSFGVHVLYPGIGFFSQNRNMVVLDRTNLVRVFGPFLGRFWGHFGDPFWLVVFLLFSVCFGTVFVDVICLRTAVCLFLCMSILGLFLGVF